MDFFLLRNGNTALMIYGRVVKEATLYYNSQSVWKFLLVTTTEKLCFLSELKISWKLVFTAHKMKGLSLIVKLESSLTKNLTNDLNV